MSVRRGALGALVGLALAATVLPLGSAPATARTVSQSSWIPVTGSVVVRGHGFGHGHGMSQYGAQGAATRGLSYRQIIDFYYPGTTWSTVRGQVRVLISADTTSDVVVGRVPGLTVRALGTGTTYPLPTPAGASRWRIVPGAGGASVVSYLTSSWHRWRTLSGDAEFSAPTPLTLYTPAGSRRYRGALRSASPTPGSATRDTVNVLSMDDYVRGVIPSEMPASWRPEAVKAQAVAARTYATWSRAQYPRRYYQICDTSYCQVYGGASAEDPRSNAAVTGTARRILTYAGRPAFTQFSSSSGGWTSAGSVPYLVARADPYDDVAGNPVHEWTTPLTADRIERVWPRLGSLRRVLVTRRDGHGEWGGRVWTLVLDGTRADVTVSGDDFRATFGLRSAWFTLDPTPITARWTAIGGAASPVGSPTSREFAVPGGSVQVFASGRIWWSRGTGAHELWGPVYTSYRSRGGAASALGLPTTGVVTTPTGQRARFVHGTITWTRSTDTTSVTVTH